jgi:phenylalanyl-tRNA synthetase beta subunit
VNLSTPEVIHFELMNNFKNLQFHRSEKPNSISRELEIHNLLEQGCVVSSEEFWEFLLKIIGTN